MKDVVSQVFIGSLSCFIALSSNAVASEKGTFSSSVGAQVTHDDNLYKINQDSELVRQLLSSFDFSDTVTSVFANAGMDWDVSRQKILASVSVTQNNYTKNAQFDNTETQYSIKWNWRAGQLFFGDLFHNENRRLANFTDNLNAALLASEIDEGLSGFSTNWQMHSRWQAQVSLNERTTEYSVDSLALNNKNVVTSSAKVTYKTEVNNSFSLSISQAKIDYENRTFEDGDTVDNEYSLSTIVLATNYHYSDKSLVSAKLLWRELEPEHATNGTEFALSDWGFNINYRWQIAPTIQLTTILADEISPSENINTDFQRSQKLNLGITWQALNKVIIGLQTKYEKRRFEFNTNLNSALQIASKNTYKKAAINIAYLPSAIIELRIGYEFNNQRSDLLLRNFDSNTTYATLVASF